MGESSITESMLLISIELTHSVGQSCSLYTSEYIVVVEAINPRVPRRPATPSLPPSSPQVAPFCLNPSCIYSGVVLILVAS